MTKRQDQHFEEATKKLWTELEKWDRDSPEYWEAIKGALVQEWLRGNNTGYNLGHKHGQDPCRQP